MTTEPVKTKQIQNRRGLMKEIAPSVVGFGDVVFDHLFKAMSNEIYYLGSRGGGSVWNVLVNLADLGVTAIGMGVYGAASPFGVRAREELEYLGVDATRLYPVKNKVSRVIGQLLQCGEEHRFPVHTFHGRCFICKQKQESSTLARTNAREFRSAFDWTSADALVMDKMTKDRVRTVLEAKRKNVGLVTVVDIGRIGHLRYSPLAQILTDINSFDIAFVNVKVFRWLTERLVSGGNKAPALFTPSGQLKALIVSEGEDGVDLHMKGDEKLHVPAPTVEGVVDTAGAGDAFLAHFLFNWLLSDHAKRFGKDVILHALRKAIGCLQPVLTQEGARGHLPVPPTSTHIPTQAYRGREINAIRNGSASDDPCPFCYVPQNGSVPVNPKAKVRRRPTLNGIMKELPRRALFLLEREEPIEKCRTILNSGKTAYVVGTGCSFSAAQYIAQVLTTQGGSMAQAIRPYDYCRGIGPRSDWLVVVSYSGSTHDCGLAIQRALNIGVPRIALVTHSHKPQLARLLRNTCRQGGDLIITYSSPHSRKEPGFVSFAGTLLPSMLFAAAAMKGTLEPTCVKGVFDNRRDKQYPNLEDFLRGIREIGIIDLFGGAFAWPAMVDFETKITEGGISTVQLHESKDFSHGRFMLVLRDRGVEAPKLFFQVGEDPYEQELMNVLLSTEAPFLKVFSEKNGLWGGLEILIEVQFLISKIANSLLDGKDDITKPTDIPREGLRLYRWQRAGR